MHITILAPSYRLKHYLGDRKRTFLVEDFILFLNIQSVSFQWQLKEIRILLIIKFN